MNACHPSPSCSHMPVCGTRDLLLTCDGHWGRPISIPFRNHTASLGGSWPLLTVRFVSYGLSSDICDQARFSWLCYLCMFALGRRCDRSPSLAYRCSMVHFDCTLARSTTAWALICMRACVCACLRGLCARMYVCACACRGVRACVCVCARACVCACACMCACSCEGTFMPHSRIFARHLSQRTCFARGHAFERHVAPDCSARSP